MWAKPHILEAEEFQLIRSLPFFVYFCLFLSILDLA